MIGKLHAWRSDHSRNSVKVGGFVSVEDLPHKSTSPTKTPRKKTPTFLSLGSIGRHSVNVKTPEFEIDPEEHIAPPPDLFSNIPASAGFSPTEFGSPPLPRPSTVDPDLTAFGRRRSKTAPTSDTPYLTLNWTNEKPVPLAIDFDQTRPRSSSNHSTHLSIDSHRNALAGASIPRPRTSQDSKTSGQTGRARSASRGQRATYSLTPAITPTQSRRPSISAPDSRRGSQTILAKTTSNASATRKRSDSQTSFMSQAPPVPPPDRPVPIPSPNRSVLDEVEGTLSATIRELQDLQGSWDENGGLRPAAHRFPDHPMHKVPSAPDVPRSAPATQAQFMARAHSEDSVPTLNPQQPGVTSLPPTPMVPSLPVDEVQKPAVPSLGRMQSIQIAYEKSKRTIQKMTVEAEGFKQQLHKFSVETDTLKQQLSFARERLAEAEEVRVERDNLETLLKEEQAKIEQVLDQLRLSKGNEQATQNNMVNLTRRLEEANVQKVDVLEENSELHAKYIAATKEMQTMTTEMEKLRSRPDEAELEDLKVQLQKSQEANKLLEEQVNNGDGRADLPAVVADLSFKLEDAARTVAEKDKYIQQLEAQTDDLAQELEQLREDLQTTTLPLQKEIAEQAKAYRVLQAQSDRYHVLLQEQLRRNAKGEHPASALLERKLDVEEAVAEIRRKAAKKIVREGGAGAADEEGGEADVVEMLEKEIEYHVKDIVLYKLDVKGYRKDIKKAQLKIQALTEARTTSVSSQGSLEEEGEVARAEQVVVRGSTAQEMATQVVIPRTSNSSTPELHQQDMGLRHIVSAWTPNVSPRTTPLSRTVLT